MRVLQVIPSLAVRTGGPAVNVVGSSLALAELGVEVKVLATDMAGPARTGERRRISTGDMPAHVDAVDVTLCSAQQPYRLAYSPDLASALHGSVSEYDVVHIHSLFLYPQFAAYRAAIQHGVPYVVSVRGALDPWLRRRGRVRKAVTSIAWQRRMLRRAAAVHVTSQQEADFVANMTWPGQCVTIPNGIDCNSFVAQRGAGNFRRTFLGGFRGNLILVHGRITRKKGLDLLIRALPRILEDRPDCVLVIVGPDDEGLAEQLRRIADECDVSSRVVFCGMLVGAERLAALAAADVWVLPSHTENFAVAAAEAFAAGVPVVASEAVGIAQGAADEGAAVICDLSPGSIASQVLHLLDSQVAREKLSYRAREYARRFDWSRVAPRLLAMYRRAAGS